MSEQQRCRISGKKKEDGKKREKEDSSVDVLIKFAPECEVSI
jgi:hypothetical protein